MSCLFHDVWHVPLVKREELHHLSSDGTREQGFTKTPPSSPSILRRSTSEPLYRSCHFGSRTLGGSGAEILSHPQPPMVLGPHSHRPHALVLVLLPPWSSFRSPTARGSPGRLVDGRRGRIASEACRPNRGTIFYFHTMGARARRGIDRARSCAGSLDRVKDQKKIVSQICQSLWISPLKYRDVSLVHREKVPAGLSDPAAVPMYIVDLRSDVHSVYVG